MGIQTCVADWGGMVSESGIVFFQGKNGIRWPPRFSRLREMSKKRKAAGGEGRNLSETISDGGGGSGKVCETVIPQIGLLYTFDAADEEDSLAFCGRRVIKKKNNKPRLFPLVFTLGYLPLPTVPLHHPPNVTIQHTIRNQP